MTTNDEALQKQTLATSIHAQLRSEILVGSILPETKLNIRDLGERFSVGLSPVREALSRLAAERLVHQSDNRGFTVMPVSVPELLDLTKARCWLNEVGLRQSIAHGGMDWEEGVLVAFHRMSRTPRRSGASSGDRNPAWEEAHRAFHQSLIAGCGSNWLIEMCERLFEASERYRHLGRLAGLVRAPLEDEHRDIMQAAIDRKADEAVELLNAHFQRTAALVQKVVGQAAAFSSKTKETE
ncbi:MAG: transcriptional regulator [Hyphomicrobiales bacterium]|nr:transcriptional regulator [Hyphomicrobiales bacterium]